MQPENSLPSRGQLALFSAAAVPEVHGKHLSGAISWDRQDGFRARPRSSVSTTDFAGEKFPSLRRDGRHFSRETMGIDQKIYLGPYFEVRSPKRIETIDRCRFQDRCPDPKNTRVDRFCKECGIELRNRITKHRKRPDFEELLDGQALVDCVDNQGLSPLEEDADESEFTSVLIPNLAHIDALDRDVWCEESQDLTELSFGNETRWMSKRYKKELEILIDAFGQENVRTRWGFLVYWY